MTRWKKGIIYFATNSSEQIDTTSIVNFLKLVIFRLFVSRKEKKDSVGNHAMRKIRWIVY